MRGIEGQAMRICKRISNPDKFIEKTALNVEKLNQQVSPQDIEKARRILSESQNSYGIAELMIKAKERSAKLEEELRKLK